CGSAFLTRGKFSPNPGIKGKAVKTEKAKVKRLIMDKDDISLTDFQRILFGEAPPEFLAEVLFRTMIIFFALLVFLRLIGKRMGGVLTFSELAVMLTLGAILAVPMQTPERGILQGLLILIVALLLQRGLNLLEFKNPKLEQRSQGEVVLL